MGLYFEATHLYSALETAKFNNGNFRYLLKQSQDYNKSLMNPLRSSYYGKAVNALLEMMERLTRNYQKPEFGIKSVEIDGKAVGVSQTVLYKKTFCKLLHFKKNGHFNQPKLLIVAPMSGHYATLLRGTVKDSLKHFDVYITDWENTRDIPLAEGNFTLDDYITYCMEFIQFLGKQVSVIAVCQPSVPVLAAVSLMSKDNSQYTPSNMVLIGGPVDTRKSPTKVNDFAVTRPLNWFEHNVITRVPINYKGFMRSVYPGFLQLAGFMAMNMQKHIGEHMSLYQHLVEGDGESVEAHKKFYDEYLAVMDIPADFYLQTIDVVFKKFSLPLGKLYCNGERVDLNSIKKTGLLVIEGELDDITGIGQTKAAIDLCSNIPNKIKHYHLQKRVGHYGAFNGTKFRTEILPIIKDFIYSNTKF